MIRWVSSLFASILLVACESGMIEPAAGPDTASLLDAETDPGVSELP
ncbi:MAG: hypothetical protein R6V85_18845 [Polyangia bacterium]